MSCADCDKAVVGWRVWCDDDRVFASQQHTWAQVPDDGVLVRMIYYRDGTKQIQQGQDYFYEAPHQSGEPIYGTGRTEDAIAQRYPGAVIKRGRWAPDAYYRRIVAAAMASTAPE